VRHATPEDLEGLADLLGHLRAVDGLVERKPGVFYRRSRAFLHFHADDSGMFVDVRFDPASDFIRLPVTSPAQQRRLMAGVRRAVGEQ
jgi:hypothetical protein